MITQQEIGALSQLLNRAPLTLAEQLWCQALMQKLHQMATMMAKSEDSSPAEGKDE